MLTMPLLIRIDVVICLVISSWLCLLDGAHSTDHAVYSIRKHINTCMRSSVIDIVYGYKTSEKLHKKETISITVHNKLSIKDHNITVKQKTICTSIYRS